MRSLLGPVVLGVLLVGATTLLIADSPYERNVEREQTPFTPPRPERVTRTTATMYLVAYEETRLSNDLLRSRGYTLDEGDRVRAECSELAVPRTAEGFWVRLRCHGAIVDSKRLVQPTGFTYTVTYVLTEKTVEERSLRGYPLSPRDELRPRPPSAT